MPFHDLLRGGERGRINQSQRGTGWLVPESSKISWWSLEPHGVLAQSPVFALTARTPSENSLERFGLEASFSVTDIELILPSSLKNSPL